MRVSARDRARGRGARRRARSWAFALACLAGAAIADLSPMEANAEVNPFLSVGGASVQTIREEQDFFFNPVEVEKWRTGWEVGLGISAIPSDAGVPSFSHPQWEARVRLSRVGGELESVVTDFARTQAPFYSMHGVETFEYSGWTLSPAALVRVHPKLGVFAAPSIQRLKFEGHEVQDWEGDIPDFFPAEDSEGSAKGTVIYGAIEVGARVNPIPALPAAGLEIYWMPKRVQMSSTQESNDTGYVANFAKLHSSVGARLTYDF
jgi:hypothetical protein